MDAMVSVYCCLWARRLIGAVMSSVMKGSGEVYKARFRS